ncbi:MAG: preprotein translocase subunit SecE [Lachnospiraceae bacterium]|nr:preprotein translocase subunit SecE [Lachnospiraceae bacterium]
MGENAKSETAPKKSWFKGLKAEFHKIIWPDKESVAKQTIAVVIVSVILCVIIAFLDAVIGLGLGFIL